MNNEYKTITYYSKSDKAYIVFAPDLPGCFADGETLDEAKKNISVIIEEWKELAKKLGREIPKPLNKVDFTNATVFDVAKYILSKTGPISTIMLQKLIYYCNAWALGWFHSALFQQELEAWVNGPVSRDLFSTHKHKYVISEEDIATDHILSDSEKKLIDNVLSVYASETPDTLVNLTHEEAPWQKARGNLAPEVYSDAKIDPAVIEEYYSKLSL